MLGNITHPFRVGIRLVIVLGTVVALLLSISGCNAGEKEETASAAAGVLDLRGRAVEKEGLLPLNGEWSFEWHGEEGETPKEGTIQVPGLWGQTPMGDGTKLTSHGRGVYRLTILHSPFDGLLAIRIPNLSTAYRLYVDGNLQISRGVVGDSAQTTTPYQLPAIAYFSGLAEKTELVLEVANYHHRNGGIRTELQLGTLGQVQTLRYQLQSQEWVVLGALLAIGFYHIGLFVLRRRELANLFLALLCIGIACRMGTIGEGIFAHWIPSITWTFAMRIEYSAFALSTLFGFTYYQKMYPDEIPSGLLKLAAGVGGALVLLCLSLPAVTFSGCVAAYQAYVVLLSFACLFGLSRALYRRREGAKLATVGAAALVLSVVNDIFFYNGWLRSFDLVSFGMLFLVLMNSFAISHRFSMTYSRAEQMKVELTEWNHSLEERIAKRTEELQKSYMELEVSKSGLERMEQSRRQLISNISHDLRTPITLLQGYLEALRDGVISEPQHRDRTVRLMLTKVEGLNGMIQDLFELSMLEARRMRMNFEPTRLNEWRDRLCAEYEPELTEKGIQFGCEGTDEERMSATVLIDEHRMDRVFANLIYNAVRHTPQGGNISLRFGVAPSEGYVDIDVIDSGTGIRESELPLIFDRFYNSNKSRHSSSGGSGLGLSIAREIVETHRGELSARNGESGGSIFTIRLPLLTEESMPDAEQITS
ncbi:sensor histidine kinase [Cohnella fermenti]|uniref:histidine kinase n=1 Tax=Cohnella fermenti TaxID=2565925 RepID=A0A4S4C134_9BACL|nr:sensor histidine kinase [Cohnella fermenti]THF81188.1 hypothetical protein E6C55_08705 [Cohnella fermenti]